MATDVIVRPERDALVALDAELARRREVIETSAASMIDPDRMRGVVLSAFSRNPELWECDPVTVVRAVIEAAQVGLEPTGAIGGAHLVPRWNNKRGKKEAQLIFDYRGLATLARRSGEISRISAGAAREKDDFAYQHGTDEWLRHVPYLDGDPGPFTHYYAIAHYRDGTSQFVVMSAAQIEAIRQRHAPRNRGGDIVGPWISDPEEMAKKTVLRNLSKLLPLTIEARTAIAFEDEQSKDQAPVRATVDRSSQLRGKLQARLAATVDAPQATETPAEPASDAECGAVLGSEECSLDAGHEGPHRSPDDEAVWPQEPEA